jgi:pyruvate formate lyase activating enzyme
MSGEKTLSGSVLRIERSSIHDGQGLRTVIFLKGCPLDCPWCSTPESKEFSFEKGYDAHLCTACGRCINTCPQRAIHFSENKKSIQTDASKCIKCFQCFDVCPNNAVKKYGMSLTAAQVMEEISKDEIFFYHSGGGVTLSGGEPLCQADFSAEVLKECKRLGIHTAVESSFHVDYANIKIILPYLDALLVDIKHMDSQRHEDWTGKDNALILENIRKTDRSRYPLEIIVRIPLLPGYNDSDENLLATLNFCQSLNKLKEIELLPYHRLGKDTYRLLGKNYLCMDIIPPDSKTLSERTAFMREYSADINIKTGSGFV